MKNRDVLEIVKINNEDYQVLAYILYSVIKQSCNFDDIAQFRNYLIKRYDLVLDVLGVGISKLNKNK